MANIKQTKEDRQRERNNLKAAILTNITVLFTSVTTLIIIGFNAYMDNEELDIARKNHYLQHIILQQQQTPKEPSQINTHENLDEKAPLDTSAKTDTLKANQPNAQ